MTDATSDATTEKAARKMWCPMRRPNPELPDATQRCIASKCMAWRWFWDDESSIKTGYCGLAGAP